MGKINELLKFKAIARKQFLRVTKYPPFASAESHKRMWIHDEALKVAKTDIVTRI